MARRADPMGQIVSFMMNQPLAIAEQALSTSKAIVTTRRKVAAEAPTVVKRKRVRTKKLPMLPGTIPVVIPPGQQNPTAAAGTAAPPVNAAGAVKPPRVRKRPPTAGATAPTGAMPALGTGTTAQQ